MAGVPVASGSDPYGSFVPPTFTGYGGGSAAGGVVPMPSARSGSHTSFIAWLVVIGVVLPVAILGGLKTGGFSFVFRGR